MATYGAKYIRWAKIKTEPDNSLPTYEPAITVGKLNKVSYTPNFAEASQYGDDMQAEYINEFKDSDVAVEVADLPNATHIAVFGSSADTASGAADGGFTSNTSNQVPYGGLAWVRCKLISGAKKYQGVYLPKVKGIRQATEDNTKGDSVTLANGKINFKGSAAANGDYDKFSPDFASEQEAKAWCDAKLNPAT